MQSFSTAALAPAGQTTSTWTVVKLVVKEGDAVAFSWTATGGSFDDSAAAETVFTCAEADEEEITVEVSDDESADVREPREYKRGHIPQAQVIPLPKIIADTSQVPQDRRVVLLCRTGRRSTKVAGYLKGQGFDNVVALRGGILAWERANLLEAIDE